MNFNNFDFLVEYIKKKDKKKEEGITLKVLKNYFIVLQ